MASPMTVAVALEWRFHRTPDGAVWTASPLACDFWQRYLAVFDSVRVVARVGDVPSALDGWSRVDAEGVSVAPIPYYVGPSQYLLRAQKVRRVLRDMVGPRDAVILRIPAHVSSCVHSLLRKRGQPYAVEVVGDPWEYLGPGTVRHPLRRFFRLWYTRRFRREIAGAASAAYVTRYALQRRYPPPAGVFTTWYSSVAMPPEAFAASPRTPPGSAPPLTAIFVGSLDHFIKGPDVLIDAVAQCAKRGLDLRVVVLGGGRCRSANQARVRALGLAKRFVFKGQVPAGQKVRAELDLADLFLLPSRTEGLPRALVEAMGRALPCVGADVGGVSELLAPEDLVPPGDAAALAAKIQEVLADPQRRARMSARNLQRAKEYADEVLRGRRVEFYRRVRRGTEEWLEAPPRSAGPESPG